LPHGGFGRLHRIYAVLPMLLPIRWSPDRIALGQVGPYLAAAAWPSAIARFYGRHRSRLVGAALLTAVPLSGHGNDLADAQQALQKGALRAAQIDLRNAVRSDPQNAQAHLWLAKVSLDLGDAAAAEREVRAASERGIDPRETVPLLAQSLLAQNKAKELLDELKPTGKLPELDAAILTARGQAALAQGNIANAKAAFALAEQAAPDVVAPLLAEARLLGSLGDKDGAQSKIDRALAMQPRSAVVLLA
jgi:tetratricopeptide (TPR) repeat protein